MSESAVVYRQPIRVVGVTKIVGPPGPRGPRGDAGDPEQVGAAVTAYITKHSDTLLAPHVSDPTPHPAYDDLPSLTLLFENGLI